jgi:hypothetical protein
MAHMTFRLDVTEIEEMPMAHRWKNDLTRDDVTPKEVYLNRRQIMAGAGRAGRGADRWTGRRPAMPGT